MPTASPGLVTFAGIGVLEGYIRLSLRGIWSARLRLDTGTPPTGTGTLAAAGGLELVGVVVPGVGGVDLVDAVWVDVIGGHGGLAREVVGAFQNAQLRDVLDAIVSATSETPSSTIATDILRVALSSWTLGRYGGGRSLDELAGAAGRALGRAIGWRILPDGKVWIGSESWPAANLPLSSDIIETFPAERRTVIKCETPALLPGVDLADVGRVTAVRHTIEPDQVRTEAWTDLPEDVLLLQRTVRQMVGLPADPGALPVVDRMAFFRAEVASAESDGTKVDLQPEAGAPVSGHQRVAVRVGVPGLVAVVKQGAVGVLGWLRGDPGRSFAAPFWEMTAGVAKLVFNADLIHLGGESGSDGMVTKKDLQQLFAAISGAAVVANDGGAALKTNIIAALTTAGWTTGSGGGQLGSSKVKAQR